MQRPSPPGILPLALVRSISKKLLELGKNLFQETAATRSFSYCNGFVESYGL